MFELFMAGYSKLQMNCIKVIDIVVFVSKYVSKLRSLHLSSLYSFQISHTNLIQDICEYLFDTIVKVWCIPYPSCQTHPICFS